MRMRQTTHGLCDGGGGGGVTPEDGNVTSSPRLVSAASDDDCARYHVCLRRRLLYHCVVLLGPAACVTAVLLALLISSPSLTVKLPGAMSVVVVSCLLIQFICSMTPSATLPIIVFYPLSLVVIPVTSCCVGISLRSRDCQPRCEAVTSSKRPAVNDQRASYCGNNDDSEAAQICQMNCDSSSTPDPASTRRKKIPPVPPAPVNHVDQSQRYLHCQCQTYIDASDTGDRSHNVDQRRASPANTLLLSRSNSRSNIRHSRYHADAGCTVSSDSYHQIGGTSSSLRPSAKTMVDGQRRLERLERSVDMCLFVLLVLIGVSFALCLISVSF